MTTLSYSDFFITLIVVGVVLFAAHRLGQANPIGTGKLARRLGAVELKVAELDGRLDSVDQALGTLAKSAAETARGVEAMRIKVATEQVLHRFAKTAALPARRHGARLDPVHPDNQGTRQTMTTRPSKVPARLTRQPADLDRADLAILDHRPAQRLGMDTVDVAQPLADRDFGGVENDDLAGDHWFGRIIGWKRRHVQRSRRAGRTRDCANALSIRIQARARADLLGVRSGPTFERMRVSAC